MSSGAAATIAGGKEADGGSRWGSFGLLRLVFASLVIAAHAPEIVDGDRHREVAFQVFGTTTLGILAVNGFFVVSGFLIALSLLNSTNLKNYAVKRIVRIYPAFVIASAICVLLVAPLAGGVLPATPRAIAGNIARAVLLCPPYVPGVFAGTHYAHLNGAMWTIQYEFACYILVVLLAIVGVLRSRWGLTAASLALLLFAPHVPEWVDEAWRHNPAAAYLFKGGVAQLFRLGGLFLAGAAFVHWRHHAQIRPALVAGAAVLLAICLFSPLTADLGFAVFGAYCIFAAAQALGRTSWAGFMDRHDISYGLYLYAWPIQKLLLWYVSFASLVWLGLLTWLLAAIAGVLSWRLVEKPAMLFSRRFLVKRPRGHGMASDPVPAPERSAESAPPARV